jgi:hypothetical protein
MRLQNLVFYFSVFSLLSVALLGYSFFFPESDMVEQWLHIERLRDASYLTNDFYVNAATLPEMSHRFLLDKITVVLLNCFSIETIHFTYYCLGLLLLPWLGYALAVRVFKLDRIVGFIAGILLLSVVMPAHFVSSTQIFPTGFKEPDIVALADPLSLGTILMFALGWPLFGVAATIVLSLVHPLIAIFAGLSAFAGDLVQRPWKWRRSHIVAGFGFLGLLVFWYRHAPNPDISSAQYFEIFRARYPHHYFPSRFPFTDWLCILAMQIVFWLCFWQVRAKLPLRSQKFVLTVVGCVLAMCVLGFVFVEVIPVRAVLLAEPYRYLYLQTVFAIIFLAVFLYQRWREGSALLWYGVLLEISLIFFGLYYLALGVFLILGELYGGLCLRRLQRIVLAGTLLASILAQSEWRGPLQIAALDQNVNITVEAERARALRVESESLGGLPAAEIYRLADFARTSTPADALFVVPPTFAAFRNMAVRALVVDAKCIEIGNPEVWRERMSSVYDFDTKSEHRDFFEYMFEMDHHYRSLPDDRIEKLRGLYGATHAVLFKETPTRFPVLFESRFYKIVALR